MTLPVVSRWLLATTVAVAPVGAVLAADIAGDETTKIHLKVEFVEVEGSRCLQPVLYGKDVQLSDYKAAEHRWLSDRYPAFTTLQWKTTFTIPTGEDPNEVPENMTFQQETAYVQRIDGSLVEVCFDIKLTVPYSGQGDSPAPR